MSSLIPINMLTSTSIEDQTSPSTISAITFSRDGTRAYVGEKTGKLSKIHLNKNSASCSWQVDAKCGPICGISVSKDESFITVFGLGDACVNVFFAQSQQDGNHDEVVSPILRWQCVGHVFSVTAAVVLGSATSSSPLVVTCCGDGAIRLFDLQRASTCTLISSSSSPSIQQVSCLSQISIPASLESIPVAVYSPQQQQQSSSSSSLLTESGNLLVWCEKTKKSNKNNNTSSSATTTTSSGFLLQVDVLGSQRHAFSSTSGNSLLTSNMMNMNMNMMTSMSNSSSMMSDQQQHKDLLQILNVTPISDLLMNSSTASSENFFNCFSWNPKNQKQEQEIIAAKLVVDGGDEDKNNKTFQLVKNVRGNNNNNNSNSSMNNNNKNFKNANFLTGNSNEKFASFETLSERYEEANKNNNNTGNAMMLCFTSNRFNSVLGNDSNNTSTLSSLSLLKDSVREKIVKCLSLPNKSEKPQVQQQQQKEQQQKKTKPVPAINGNKNNVGKLLAASIANFYLACPSSYYSAGVIRQRTEEKDENEQESLEAIVERCKETRKLIDELNMQKE